MTDTRTPTPATPGGPAPDGMVWVPGGESTMGSDAHYPEEAPAHRVAVDGFWMDRSPVTNADFARFVAETGHVTTAQVPPDAADYPDALPELLVAASAVFVSPAAPVPLGSPYLWWAHVPGADWRHPHGPASSIDGLGDHPVVHVTWDDVAAYAAWAGRELPTEAEWEHAARGGADDTEFAWGDELTPGGRHMANVWQGDFPHDNRAEDGWERTSPVGSFPANGYGLVDMIGNVWEWTDDWYVARHEVTHACCTVDNPRGPARDASVDPRQPGLPVPRKAMKGGSHLCAPNYCRRYRPAARMPQAVDTSTSHLGFRTILRP
jgi:formylglycine-generating enzyme required for sulfatase activity